MIQKTFGTFTLIQYGSISDLDTITSMSYTYAYIFTINAFTLELNFFADMNIKLFTTLP